MLFSKALFASASLITCALAQTRIAFQSVPAVAVTGETYNVTWGGGDGTAVTITLRKGDPNDLTTIGILGEGITKDFFPWEVSKSLTPDDDYALQITQGQDQINYSGLFSITAGNGTASNATSTTATGNSTASITASSHLTASTGTGTTLPRNTTFSSATISATTSLAAGTTQHASTSSSRASSSPTAAATTSAPNSEAGQLASSIALVMGVFAAVMFLS